MPNEGKRKGGNSDEAGKTKAKKSKEVGEKSKKKEDKRTAKNPLEMLKGPFFVDVIKGKRHSKQNGLEYHVGWRGYLDPKMDTWEPLKHLSGSEHMVAEFEKNYQAEYDRKSQEAAAAKIAKRKAEGEANAAAAKVAGDAISKEGGAKGSDDESSAEGSDDEAYESDSAGVGEKVGLRLLAKFATHRLAIQC
jgi:hypothetical protein